jgi:hypothetical protein
MNWQKIKITSDGSHFILDNEILFSKKFIEVLKFHEPGLAPVMDESGAYHIDASGSQLYDNRYDRTFGYYCNRAAVIKNNEWCHIDEKGCNVWSK